jgi:hypothetical protein
MSDNSKVEGLVHWRIYYWGTGTLQLTKIFYNEGEAIGWWEGNLNNPYVGLHSLEKVEIVRKK